MEVAQMRVLRFNIEKTPLDRSKSEVVRRKTVKVGELRDRTRITEGRLLNWTEDAADGGRSKREVETEKTMGRMRERRHKGSKCN